MKKIILYLKKQKVFIAFLFLFSWILTLKNRIGLAIQSDDFNFTFDTPFWVFLNAFLIFILIDYLKTRTDKNIIPSSSPLLKSYFKPLAIGFVAYLIYINLFGLLVSLIFDTFSQNYHSAYQIITGLINYIIDFFIFGGLSLAWLYYNENKEYKQRISAYDRSVSKSKIQQLKAQLNPHFLFNNLNILDQLIDEDQEKASEFLSQFAELYRYSLSSSDKELISLQEEVEFAKNYFELMERKYEGYYQLKISGNIQQANIIVPPFCLQLLIENAIVHNMGTAENPVIINISIDNSIEVSNNTVSKKQKQKGHGVALKNLSEQFLLLTNNPVFIREEKEKFIVRLPLVKTYHND